MSFSLRKDNCFNVELMMWWWKFYFRDVFLTFQRCETYLLMVKRKISMPMIFLKRHKNRIFCQNPGDLWWPPTSKIMFFSAVFRKVWWPLVTFFWWPQPGGHQRSPEKKHTYAMWGPIMFFLHSENVFKGPKHLRWQFGALRPTWGGGLWKINIFY